MQAGHGDRTAETRSVIQLVLLLLATSVALYVLMPARAFTPGQRLSAWMLRGMHARFGGESKDAASTSLIQRAADRVRAPAGDRLPPVQLSVLRSPQPNAFAVGVHHVCVTEGLLDVCERREDLIAPVLAHEFGHILAGHAARRFKNQAFGIGLAVAATFVLRSPWLLRSSGLLRSLVLASFSRSQEFEADACAIWLLDHAGYDPAKLADVLARLDDWYRHYQGRQDDALTRFFSTHPPLADRIREIEAARTPD